MSAELVPDGKVMRVKAGAIVEAASPKTRFILDEDNNRFTKEVDGKEVYTVTFEWEGDDIVNLKRIFADVSEQLQEPDDKEMYLKPTKNGLNLVGGTVVDELIPSYMSGTFENNEINVTMMYGEQMVTCTASLDNGETVMSNIVRTVDGTEMKTYDDGHIDLYQSGNLLLCDGGEILDDLPTRIHEVSDTELQITYGNDIWKYTWEWTEDDNIKNLKKTKLQGGENNA